MGNGNNKMRIDKSVLFSVIVCIVIIIAIIFTTISYVLISADHVISNANASLLSTAINNSNAAETYFNGKLHILGSYSQRFAEAGDDEDRLNELMKECEENCGFRNIQYMIKDGETHSASGEHMNTTHRAFVQDGLAGKNSIYSQVTCDFCKNLGDFYSVPVMDESGNIIGVLTGESDIFTMPIIKPIDVSDIEGCNFIIDTDGSVIYASENSPSGLRSGDNIIDLSAEEDSVELRYMLSRITGGDIISVKIGEKIFDAAFSSIDSTYWSYVVIAPHDELLNRAGSFVFLTVVLICVIVVLISIAVILLFAKFIKKSNEVNAIIDEKEKSLKYDSVTNHAAWGSFADFYNKKMKNTSAKYALLSVDIDKFAVINDSLGYDGGNEILKQVSDIIERNIGPDDFFARSAGDLFYLLCEYEDKEDIIDLATRLMAGVDYEVTIFKMYISIGIFLINDYNIKCRAACDRSDMARKSIKKQKKSKYAFFDSSMIETIRSEKSIENIMEDALERREFIVYLQPKFNLDDPEHVAGAEALVRWKHDGKLVPPGNFIPVFEKNGFVTKIDFFMLEEVCRLQKKWKNAGFEPRVISVNMSRLHLRNPHFVDDLAEMCEKYEIDTKYIEIEITESAAYENIDILYNVFTSIREKGFHISIDDFGTGYSSLNMLKDLPVDVLKIDRSFLTESADENENASHIIGCVVSLASSLNIATICEGIETKEQAHLLTKLGCNMAQGFFFARPMPVEDFEKLAYYK